MKYILVITQSPYWEFFSTVFAILFGYYVALILHKKASANANDIATLLFTEIRQITGKDAFIEFNKKTGKPKKVVYGGGEASVKVEAEGKGIKKASGGSVVNVNVDAKGKD